MAFYDLRRDPDPPPPDAPPPAPQRRRGVFDPARVRFASFVAVSICLFATALICVLAIWDYASPDVAWRSAATLGVIVATTIIFTIINERFGT